MLRGSLNIIHVIIYVITIYKKYEKDTTYIFISQFINLKHNISLVV